jgi:hypothetical protein
METNLKTKKVTTPELRVFLNSINRPEINVTVKDGVVTLTGIVESLEEKLSARKAVASVLGVKGIINNITVSDSVFYNKDNEIAEAILSAIRLSTCFRPESKKGSDKELQYWEIFA